MSEKLSQSELAEKRRQIALSMFEPPELASSNIDVDEVKRRTNERLARYRQSLRQDRRVVQ